MAPGNPAIRIESERVHPVLSVPDIPAAVKFWTEKLGFWLAFTWPETGEPTFAGVNLGDTQTTQVYFSKGAAHPGQISFEVDDADRLYAFHQAHGVEIIEPIADRAYGLRDYAVRDLHGYALSFGHVI